MDNSPPIPSTELGFLKRARICTLNPPIKGDGVPERFSHAWGEFHVRTLFDCPAVLPVPKQATDLLVGYHER